jgi:hypothetical protein
VLQQKEVQQKEKEKEKEKVQHVQMDLHTLGFCEKRAICSGHGLGFSAPARCHKIT